MNDFFDKAFEVISVQKVKDRALRLLQVHPLRAADAMQLASVLVATQEDTSRVPIMSFDGRLTLAAKREGFTRLRQDAPCGSTGRNGGRRPRRNS